MSGVIALLALAIWGVLGYVLWRYLVLHRVRSMRIRFASTILFVLVWLIGPFIDEILGAREFRELCEEMPPVKFYGAVPVGAGPFYEEDGTPRWKNSDEFSKILRESGVWDKLFETHDEISLLKRSPVPVFEYRSIHLTRDEGRISVESTSRLSPGGWIRRVSGWGSHAPYQCSYKGAFPRDEERIKFKAE